MAYREIGAAGEASISLGHGDDDGRFQWILRASKQTMAKHQRAALGFGNKQLLDGRESGAVHRNGSSTPETVSMMLFRSNEPGVPQVAVDRPILIMGALHGDEASPTS